MFERFTEKAIKVIMLAQEEARRLGHNFVGTEQMLLGLIGEGSGIASKTLKSMGINLDDARVEVKKIIGRGSGFVSVEIPFTPRAKRLLELSWDEARQLRHNYIGTEHLLLGLIREGEGVAAKVLQNLGADLPEIRCHVFETLGKSLKEAAANNPSDMHSQGSWARVLFQMGKYSEANDYFSRALLLPGGEFYKADADVCKEQLDDVEKS